MKLKSILLTLAIGCATKAKGSQCPCEVIGELRTDIVLGQNVGCDDEVTRQPYTVEVLTTCSGGLLVQNDTVFRDILSCACDNNHETRIQKASYTQNGVSGSEDRCFTPPADSIDGSPVLEPECQASFVPDTTLGPLSLVKSNICLNDVRKITPLPFMLLQYDSLQCSGNLGTSQNMFGRNHWIETYYVDNGVTKYINGRLECDENETSVFLQYYSDDLLVFENPTSLPAGAVVVNHTSFVFGGPYNSTGLEALISSNFPLDRCVNVGESSYRVICNPTTSTNAIFMDAFDIQDGQTPTSSLVCSSSQIVDYHYGLFATLVYIVAMVL